ncbi:MAG: DUF1592 domain-containing protein [Bryobacteraceae bacterium]|nr:DUF1592 domain-containing protein [Bryobacteraceae bacterium]
MRFHHGVFFASIAVALSAAESQPAAARAVLDQKCTACHRGASAPGGFDLSAMAFDLNDTHTYSRWVRVHDAVREGKMPPGGGLPEAQRAAFLKSVAAPMIAHEKGRNVTQGRSVLRRLNRYEYENTVRDLLAAQWLQLRDSLPEDGIVGRFNKVGQALDVSHVQMARYMETAEQALRSVLAASKVPEVSNRYYARDSKRMLNRMRYSSFNRHPERASIPILGFDAQPDVLAEKVPITVGDKDPKTRELEGFATPAGNYVGNEHHFEQFAAKAGGRYKLRFHAFSIWIHTVFNNAGRGDKIEYWRPDREHTSKGRTTEPITIYALSKGGEKRLLGSFDVGPEPAFHDLDIYLLPGEQILPDAARLFRSRPGFRGSPDATKDGMPGVAYRWMDVTGPVPDGASQARLVQFFGKQGGSQDLAEAERLLRSFLGRALRRPVLEAEVQRYLPIISSRLGSGFQEALIAGYTAALCSPGFIYMEERPGPLNSWALASRLSYFLWNGPPDDELRALAAKGALAKPDVLRGQAERLMESRKSREFVNAFLDYWLDLRKLNETTPDVVLYPDYYLDDLLTESAQQETQLFFEQLVRKNLPARNLVRSDFTVLNSHLARHYGLPPVEGVAMRPVSLPAGSVRGGLLTQASVLKVTANGTTTSPVLRGVWLMERILGDPPPPPPPGVPAVEPDTRGATTIRQQLDKHRAVPSCASCHVKIDPPGFALENFDVLGAWRDRYRSTEEGEPVKGLGKNGHDFTFRLGQTVDASGEVAGGGKFRDINGLKDLLCRDERQIARNLARQFITYATGAPASFGDRAEVERILDASARDGYGVRTLIHQIVRSDLFTHK